MNKYKRLTAILIASFIILVAGCSRSFGRPVTGSTVGGAPTETAIAIPTRLPVTAANTAAPVVSRTPAPTQDVISALVTQAYQQVTPRPRATQSPSTITATTPAVPLSIAGLLTPTTTLSPASASVIFSEPILIANAVNAADCKIRGQGDCASTMETGVTLFFTWTFGVQGATPFQWGQAAVVITRDGDTFKWTQAGNGLVRPPNSDTNQSWSLNVGQSAKFAAGLDNAQRGSYTARLLMCTLAPNECNAGQGWQNVGGEAIRFVIGP